MPTNRHTDRQTDTLTDNKGRLKLAAREPSPCYISMSLIELSALYSH